MVERQGHPQLSCGATLLLPSQTAREELNPGISKQTGQQHLAGLSSPHGRGFPAQEPEREHRPAELHRGRSSNYRGNNPGKQLFDRIRASQSPVPPSGHDFGAGLLYLLWFK